MGRGQGDHDTFIPQVLARDAGYVTVRRHERHIDTMLAKRDDLVGGGRLQEREAELWVTLSMLGQ